jgi:hypothetical protein
LTERTDFQVVEDEEPEEPDDPCDPDELPWEDVDLDGDGVFAEGFELGSAAAVAPGVFAEADVCSSGVGVLCFDGEANESRPGPSAPGSVDGSARLVRDVSSVCLSVTTIAVTQTTIVVMARAPAR